MGTDLEVGIRIDVPGFEVEAPGSVVLPIARFVKILAGERRREAGHGKRRPQDLGSRPAERVSVALGESRRVSRVCRPSRRRSITRCRPASSAKSIRRTVFATDNESSRYALGGVLVELTDDGITAVATDGRRLARQEGPAKAVGGHAIGRPHDDHSHPGHATAWSGPWPTTTRTSNSPPATTTCWCAAAEAVIYSRLVEGRYPQVARRLPAARGHDPGGSGGRAVLCGGPPGGDRHQRGAPRRGFHLRRRQGGAGRRTAPNMASRTSNCPSPTTAPKWSSPSIRVT